MNRSEILETIDSSLAEEFELDREELRPEASFIDDLELDSLDYVDMVVALEQAFGFKLKNKEDLKEIRTVGDLHEYIFKKYEEFKQEAPE
ncbi:MAG: acyl carrier protein [Desulfonatronovibrionaceae bacterium]